MSGTLRTPGPSEDPLPDLDGVAGSTGADLLPLQVDDPRSVGRWTVLAALRPGGFARVYLAHDQRSPHDLVVVKVPNLAPHGTDVARLEQEVRNVRRIADSQFVARIVDYVRDPVPAVVQDFVAGPTLDEVLREAVAGDRMRTGDAVGIAAGLLQAVAAVHDSGVAHRDLSPRNVILHSLRGPVLIDFGSSLHRDDARITVAGDVVGTARFMSPERMNGQAGDDKADVFAWGIITALLLSGRHPFDPTGRCVTFEDFRGVILASSPDLSAVPRSFQRMLAAALSRAPERRPTALELITKMDAIARAPEAGLDSGGLGPGRTRIDPLAAFRGLDPAAFLRSLGGINAASAERSRQDRSELLWAAKGPAERIAVRIHYHPRAPLVARRSVRAVAVALSAVVGLALGTVVALGVELLWVTWT